ncbi:MAG: trpC [Herbinix sp.]|nr:trpC [Herbinix sp.]
MILDKIAASTRIRVEDAKKQLSAYDLIKRLKDTDKIPKNNHREVFAFEKALRKDHMAFICEVKKASPSKGILVENFPYLSIAKEYEEAGADAISVLTEPEFFKGNDRYLSEISSGSSVPLLRKDFTLDEYQIYEAKLIGADAVLLICSLLDTKTLKHFIRLCDQLKISALVEAHTEEEVKSALEAGARIIGVNNRNLHTFEVNLDISIRLRALVPEEIIFVAESGIRSSLDVLRLREAGVNAVLIGETLMKSENKSEMLLYLKEGRKNRFLGEVTYD